MVLTGQIEKLDDLNLIATYLISISFQGVGGRQPALPVNSLDKACLNIVV